jgi:hypothetical protein
MVNRRYRNKLFTPGLRQKAWFLDSSFAKCNTMNPELINVANVVMLDPRYRFEVRELKQNVFYTYYRTLTREGISYVYIDQVHQWYPKELFIDQDIQLN